MATSPGSSSSSSRLSNPFLSAAPIPISAASIQLINIRNHVRLTLDLAEPNFSPWRTFFDVVFRKFGVLDHVDGTVDARLKLDDAEWTQTDYSIVLWLYTTVSKDILDIVLTPHDTAHHLWLAINNLFLDNQMQRAVYAQQEFHSLYQGSLTVTEYCSRLKILADTLRDVGSPISDQALVLNTFRGLNSKFSHAVSVLTMQNPPPSFLRTRSYFLQEEHRLAQPAQMEAATALYASGPPHPQPQPTTPPNTSTSGDRMKKRK